MNRYLIDGILTDLAEGKDIIVVGPTLRASEAVLHEVLSNSHSDAWARIIRANGNEHATHQGGGTLRTVAATPALRGRRTDILLLLDRGHFTPAQQHEIGHAIHASRNTGCEVQSIAT